MMKKCKLIYGVLAVIVLSESRKSKKIVLHGGIFSK